MQIRRGIKRSNSYSHAFDCLRAVQIRRGIKQAEQFVDELSV